MAMEMVRVKSVFNSHKVRILGEAFERNSYIS